METPLSKNKTNKDPYAARESRRYETPIASREHILAAIEEQGKLDFRGIVSYLGIKGQDGRSALKKRLGAMCRDRQLQANGDYFDIPRAQDALRGKVQAHPRRLWFSAAGGQGRCLSFGGRNASSFSRR